MKRVSGILMAATTMFLLTLGTFMLTIVPLRANTCYEVGAQGIGPNCADSNEFGSCSACAGFYCALYAGINYPECGSQCISGALSGACS